MLAVAIGAVFAVTLTVAGTAVTLTAVPALADSSQPNESARWTQEGENGTPVVTYDTMTEARQSVPNGTEDLVQVWRAVDNRIAIAFNNGSISFFPTAQTYAAPQVVPYGPNRFMIFQTGTDGNIYWSQSSTTDSGADLGNPGTWSHWVQVPGQATPNNDPPAVANMGPSHEWELFLMYRSANGDNGLYASYWNGSTWNGGQQILYVQSYYAPSVAWNDACQCINAAHTGTDGSVYTARQPYGFPTNSFTAWVAPGQVTTNRSPAIAANSGGWVLLSAVDSNNLVHFNRYGNNTWYGWTQETQYYNTYHPVFLSVLNRNIYILLTGTDNHVYWKLALSI